MATITTDRRERIAALEYDYAAQPKQAQDACNLCGRSEFVILAHRDRYGYPAEAHACRHCGLVFLNPRMTAEAYGRFYDGIYRPLVSAFHGRLIDARTQFDAQLSAKGDISFVQSLAAGAGLTSTVLLNRASTATLSGSWPSGASNGTSPRPSNVGTPKWTKVFEVRYTA